MRDFVFPMFRANARVRRRVPARHLDRAAADRQAPGRDRAQDRRRRDLPRRHRQGQRPGAFRARRLRADAGRQSHRALARVGSRCRARSCSRTPTSTAFRSTSRSAKAARRIRWTPTCCTSSYEGGMLEDPDYEPEESMWRLTVSPEKAPDKPEVRRTHIRARRHRRGQWQEAVAGASAGDAERARRQARHRPARPGREPLRRHEVARLLRNAGRHDHAEGPPRDRIDHARPRGASR